MFSTGGGAGGGGGRGRWRPRDASAPAFAPRTSSDVSPRGRGRGRGDSAFRGARGDRGGGGGLVFGGRGRGRAAGVHGDSSASGAGVGGLQFGNLSGPLFAGRAMAPAGVSSARSASTGMPKWRSERDAEPDYAAQFSRPVDALDVFGVDFRTRFAEHNEGKVIASLRQARAQKSEGAGAGAAPAVRAVHDESVAAGDGRQAGAVPGRPSERAQDDERDAAPSVRVSVRDRLNRAPGTAAAPAASGADDGDDAAADDGDDGDDGDEQYGDGGNSDDDDDNDSGEPRAEKDEDYEEEGDDEDDENDEDEDADADEDEDEDDDLGAGDEGDDDDSAVADRVKAQPRQASVSGRLRELEAQGAQLRALMRTIGARSRAGGGPLLLPERLGPSAPAAGGAPSAAAGPGGSDGESDGGAGSDSGGDDADDNGDSDNDESGVAGADDFEDEYEAAGIDSKEARAFFREFATRYLRPIDEKLLAQQQGGRPETAAPTGTCMDRCSIGDRLKRCLTYTFDRFERIPAAQLQVFMGAPQSRSLDQQIDRALVERMVTRYERSDAGKLAPPDYNIRPESVLLSTTEYLLGFVADRGVDLLARYNFLRDRFRAILNEASIQRLCSVQVVGAMERMARFFIACHHLLCGHGSNDFSPKSNFDMLSSCLTSLCSLYIELRERGERCPNEDEFWAYRVMTMIEGSLRELELPLLPMDVRCGPRLLHALQVRVLFETGQHTRFFRTAENSDYLMACLMHAEFNRMRFVALSQFASGGVRHVDVDWLRTVLRFEDAGHLETFLRDVGMRMPGGGKRLVEFPGSKELTDRVHLMGQRVSSRIETLRRGRSLKEVVLALPARLVRVPVPRPPAPASPAVPKVPVVSPVVPRVNPVLSSAPAPPAPLKSPTPVRPSVSSAGAAPVQPPPTPSTAVPPVVGPANDNAEGLARPAAAPLPGPIDWGDDAVGPPSVVPFALVQPVDGALPFVLPPAPARAPAPPATPASAPAPPRLEPVVQSVDGGSPASATDADAMAELSDGAAEYEAGAEPSWVSTLRMLDSYAMQRKVMTAWRAASAIGDADGVPRVEELLRVARVRECVLRAWRAVARMGRRGSRPTAVAEFLGDAVVHMRVVVRAASAAVTVLRSVSLGALHRGDDQIVGALSRLAASAGEVAVDAERLRFLCVRRRSRGLAAGSLALYWRELVAPLASKRDVLAMLCARVWHCTLGDAVAALGLEPGDERAGAADVNVCAAVANALLLDRDSGAVLAEQLRLRAEAALGAFAEELAVADDAASGSSSEPRVDFESDLALTRDTGMWTDTATSTAVSVGWLPWGLFDAHDDGDSSSFALARERAVGVVLAMALGGSAAGTLLDGGRTPADVLGDDARVCDALLGRSTRVAVTKLSSSSEVAVVHCDAYVVVGPSVDDLVPESVSSAAVASWLEGIAADVLDVQRQVLEGSVDAARSAPLVVVLPSWRAVTVDAADRIHAVAERAFEAHIVFRVVDMSNWRCAARGLRAALQCVPGRVDAMLVVQAPVLALANAAMPRLFDAALQQCIGASMDELVVTDGAAFADACASLLHSLADVLAEFVDTLMLDCAALPKGALAGVVAQGSEIAEALHDSLATEMDAWLDETSTGRTSSWVTAWVSGVWERMRDSLEVAATRRVHSASALMDAVVCQLEPEGELPLGARVAVSADPVSWIANAAQTLFVRQLASEADSGEDGSSEDDATTCAAVWRAAQALGGACILWTDAVQPLQWRPRKRRSDGVASDLRALRSLRVALHGKATELRASADATLKRAAPSSTDTQASGRRERAASASSWSVAKRHASASVHGYAPLLADVRRAVGEALALVGDEHADGARADR